MTLKTKGLLYNFIGFALLFIIVRIVAEMFTNLTGFWLPLTAFIVATLLAPKFQTVQTSQGEKLFMKWLFFKGVKEVK